MRTANLTITAADGLQPGCTIDVHIEYDDGYVAYATFRDGYRCWVNTGDQSQWEERIRADWAGRPESEIELSPELRSTMVRAARAGLVACGARRLS